MAHSGYLCQQRKYITGLVIDQSQIDCRVCVGVRERSIAPIESPALSIMLNI